MTKQEYAEKLKKWKERDFSWSQLSSFEWSADQWYRNYFLGEREPETAEMKFGKKFAQSIEDGTCEVKELLTTLQDKKEHPFRVKFGNMTLIGYADAFCDKSFKKLDEVKTGKKAWTQKRADEHGQFDMYLLMNYITNKIRPEEVDCTLYWIPTQDNGDFSISFVQPIKVHPFKTKRTMADILTFGSRINNAVKEMEAYAKLQSL